MNLKPKFDHALAQGVDMGVFLNAAGFERQMESPLQGRTTQGAGGGGRSCASPSTFGREKERRMAMGFPLLAEQFQGALGQGHVAVSVAFAATNVEQHPLRIDVAHLQSQAFTQTQPAGVNGG